MIYKVAAIIFALLFLPGGLHAQFIPGLFHSKEGVEMPYQLFRPAASGALQYPLVVYLHSSAGRGNDNSKHITIDSQVLDRFTDPLLQNETPAFVLAPQCGFVQKWVDCDWKQGNYSMDTVPESDQMKAVIQLVGTLAKSEPIDVGRIFIVGVSMGGFGVWDALERHPELFRAAIVVCGGGDTAHVSSALHIPVWVFHGADDEVVPVRAAREMVKALSEIGGGVFYTEYPFVGHASWAIAAKENDLTNWFFQRSDVYSGPPQVENHEENYRDHDWYDLLGRLRFHGTRDQLVRSQETGCFLGRSGKVFKFTR